MSAPMTAPSRGRPYWGAFPIVPTTFDEQGDLDLEGQLRAVDFCIDAGSAGLCILANYSEQFALTDGERERLTGAILDHVAGRVPVIVTTSHFSTRVAAERSRQAQAAGAAMIGIEPDVDLSIEGVLLARDGDAVELDEITARRLGDAMKQREVEVEIVLPDAEHTADIYFCDIGHDYVTLNAEYTT